MQGSVAIAGVNYAGSRRLLGLIDRRRGKTARISCPERVQRACIWTVRSNAVRDRSHQDAWTTRVLSRLGKRDVKARRRRNLDGHRMKTAFFGQIRRCRLAERLAETKFLTKMPRI